jgi:phage terminase large subunit GpA-like protein
MDEMSGANNKVLGATLALALAAIAALLIFGPKPDAVEESSSVSDEIVVDDNPQFDEDRDDDLSPLDPRPDRTETTETTFALSGAAPIPPKME